MLLSTIFFRFDVITDSNFGLARKNRIYFLLKYIYYCDDIKVMNYENRKISHRIFLKKKPTRTWIL